MATQKPWYDLFLSFWECATMTLPCSGPFCPKLLLKMRGQETILYSSREHRGLVNSSTKKKFGYPGCQRMSLLSFLTPIVCQDSKPMVISRQQCKAMWWHFPCIVQQHQQSVAYRPLRHSLFVLPVLKGLFFHEFVRFSSTLSSFWVSTDN